MASGKFVSYLRVSTDKQGERGLGIEGQRKAVTDFLNGGDWKLVAEYVEVESGKRNDRPKLAAAMHHAKVTGARLLIAKLDRLSRDAHFLLGLQKTGVRFTACDLPDANELTIGILALVAQNEREAISRRTREALGVVKAAIAENGSWTSRAGNRITRLGQKHGARYLLAAGKGNAAAVDKIKAEADRHAADIMPVIEDIQASGVSSLNGIAAELNARSILTARGGQWHAMTVRNLLARVSA